MTNFEFSDDKGTLTADGQNSIANGLAVLKTVVALNNYEKGWRTPPLVADQSDGFEKPKRNVGELIALLHSEVSEAFESYRNHEPELWYEHTYFVTENGERTAHKSSALMPLSEQPTLTNRDGETVLGKPQGIASELADVLIRLVDMADEHEIPLIQAVLDKHAYNQTRPYRHGGKKA